MNQSLYSVILACPDCGRKHGTRRTFGHSEEKLKEWWESDWIESEEGEVVKVHFCEGCDKPFPFEKMKVLKNDPSCPNSLVCFGKPDEDDLCSDPDFYELEGDCDNCKWKELCEDVDRWRLSGILWCIVITDELE